MIASIKQVRAASFAVASAFIGLCSSSVSAAPDFVPKPSAVYESFQAINGPRAELPVGALWIEGFGPFGDGASAENLETVRGLSGITISRDLEIKLTAGLLDLLGIDPGLRKQYQARFTDISIIRVKDAARLSGPKGEARIIEAMKVGSIVITTDRQLGLDLDKRALGTPLLARATSNGRNGSTIEGRDMFVAMRVAKTVTTRSAPELLSFERRDDILVAKKGGLALYVQLASCGETSVDKCQRPDTWGIGSAPADTEGRAASLEAGVTLPLPQADGRGGIFTRAHLQVVAPCRQLKAKGCGSDWRAWLELSGERVEELGRVQAPRW